MHHQVAYHIACQSLLITQNSFHNYFFPTETCMQYKPNAPDLLWSRVRSLDIANHLLMHAECADFAQTRPASDSMPTKSVALNNKNTVLNAHAHTYTHTLTTATVAIDDYIRLGQTQSTRPDGVLAWVQRLCVATMLAYDTNTHAVCVCVADGSAYANVCFSSIMLAGRIP